MEGSNPVVFAQGSGIGPESRAHGNDEHPPRLSGDPPKAGPQGRRISGDLAKRPKSE